MRQALQPRRLVGARLSTPVPWSTFLTSTKVVLIESVGSIALCPTHAAVDTDADAGCILAEGVQQFCQDLDVDPMDIVMV